jgi:flagellar biosynthesis activator protein FlaF
MSLQSYQSTQTITEGPRQTEYRLFALVTRALMDAEDKQIGDKDYYGAVDWNRRLWSTLQFDLAADDNLLPDELKAKLLSLAIWVDKHSSLALKGKVKVGPLISVNRSIMEGLA